MKINFKGVDIEVDDNCQITVGDDGTLRICARAQEAFPILHHHYHYPQSPWPTYQASGQAILTGGPASSFGIAIN
jgi:hypothetical protein